MVAVSHNGHRLVVIDVDGAAQSEGSCTMRREIRGSIRNCVLVVAKRTLKPRIADRVLMYRAKKELPVRTDRGRIQKGEQVTADKAEVIAYTLGAKLEELFEPA